MEIHKPKPWHGLGEFLKEYLIIVVGVLTALAAEQAVEALRWGHETAAAREALGREITNNQKSLQLLASQDGCMKTRLDALDAWADGAAPRPAGAGRPPTFFFMHTSAWDVANSAQVVAHFPLEDQFAYAQTYARIKAADVTTMEERAAWREIVALADMPDPSPQDFRSLLRAVRVARKARASRISVSENLLLRGNASLAVPGPGPILIRGSLDDPAAFCAGAELGRD